MCVCVCVCVCVMYTNNQHHTHPGPGTPPVADPGMPLGEAAAPGMPREAGPGMPLGEAAAAAAGAAGRGTHKAAGPDNPRRGGEVVLVITTTFISVFPNPFFMQP